MTQLSRRMAGVALLCTFTLALTACATIGGDGGAQETPQPSASVPVEANPGEANPAETVPLAPVGEPRVLATGLTSPWSVVRLTSGSALISERDTARIVEFTASGTVRTAGVVAGVAHGGEGGLLGLAVRESGDGIDVFAYFTTTSDNRVVRMPLLGAPGSYRLGDAAVILSGLPSARNHNGGRIKFGPDGMLYVTVGDAGVPDRAQDPHSLGGKILRVRPDGAIPHDNPTPGSYVYSRGHRNPQGLAWDDRGRLWASEFGQNTWDELNLITPGGNYGWPIVEGATGGNDFVDPVFQWPTSEASPSGLAFVRGTFFLAALRGERLWVIHPGPPPDAVGWFAGEFGRLRDVTTGANGTVWVLTNNTDGRGGPRPGDDKLLEVRVEPFG